MVSSSARHGLIASRVASGAAPATRPLPPTPVATPEDAASARRVTALPRRWAVDAPTTILTALIAMALALAPLLALATAIWATITALDAAWRLTWLIQSGQALNSSQTVALLETLDIAGRAGFLSAGYLALIFSLITLMAGFFGRRWGRLYLIPGATFTVTALSMFITGLLIAQPLEHTLSLAPAWFIPLVVYALADAILVSGVLVDARPARSPSALA